MPIDFRTTPTAVETARLIRRLGPELKALGIARVALFGSVAKGTATPQSDVDLLIDFAPGRKSFDSFMAVAELLEDALGRHVDVITREGLSPRLGPAITQTAQDIDLGP